MSSQASSGKLPARHRRPCRPLTIGPLSVYCEARHLGVRLGRWGTLAAVPTWAWLSRGWWCWQWVGRCLVVRGFVFTLTVWEGRP